ncbi:Putative 2-heptyl-3-hydroxy-4(1H)-quinolone synthase AqdB1 [Methylobacterium crusticola]|uniref:2-heptyl-3-hydroxy-4(1H)-quinolone synthase AqdB1 n=1 Tax=Methylobacterium crusticola TaxID=1697972 RepID=A0ABQ4R6V1_9HYPH|nr:NAD(P)/FAD-dependent oxidoreductase [Methylobacterium crusticola]GJD52949.1 Putative 2-heptyl-3-hydroxy-4(1H)-quinolone synthase AqdB1 [Methylobacterium crusticola]
MSRRAEIAGAGFAGLAAAAMLARRGWSVRVHEAADAPRSVGAGIYVYAFAQEVLRQIGAFADFDAHAFAPTSRTIYVDGAARSTTPTDGLYRTTTRAVLHRAVLDAARRAGVEVATRSRAVGAEAGGVLSLEDGRSLEADLVVAADGVRASVAHRLGLTIARTQHQNGITRVLLDRTGMRGPAWDGIRDYYDYRTRPLRVLYTPCGPDAFYFCLMAPSRDGQATRVPVEIALWAEAFPALAPALGRIGPSGRHDRYTTTRLPRWSRGRVAVVGDAAHAMPSSLGQGAGVSMLNAVRMAEAVDAAEDVEAGLAGWEASLRPVVEQWQREAEGVSRRRSLGEAVHPGGDLPGERPGDLPPIPSPIPLETAP